MNKVNKRIIGVWIVMRTIVLLIIMGLIGWGLYAYQEQNFELGGFGKIWGICFLITAILVGLLLVFYAYILPFLQYRYYSYEIKESEIWIKKGVLFRRTSIIPVSQIQKILAIHGIIHLLFRVKSVAVVTPGSNHLIFGLSFQESEDIAFKLNDNIKNRITKLNSTTSL